MDAETLKSKIDIRAHAQRLGLKFDAKNKTALCPWHDDKKPSLSFKDDFCKCFACNNGGDIFSLHMQVKKCEFKTAIAEIEGMYGYSDTAKPARRRKKEKPAQTTHTNTQSAPKKANDEHPDSQFRDVYAAFYGQLTDPSGDVLKYLTGPRRGLMESTIQRFGIKAVSDYRKISDFMKANFELTVLQQSGLFNDGGNLTFYRHKIIIPFFDDNRNITYLRGRYFHDGSPDPEEKSMGKMFGLKGRTSSRLFNFTTLTNYDDGPVCIAEGEFDAMVLEQNGNKAVGLLGMNNWAKNSYGEKDEIIEESWMAEALKYHQVILCIDNAKPGDPSGRETEIENLQKAIYGIADTFFQLGHYNIHIPQLPLDIKDITDAYIQQIELERELAA